MSHTRDGGFNEARRETNIVVQMQMRGRGKERDVLVLYFCPLKLKNLMSKLHVEKI